MAPGWQEPRSEVGHATVAALVLCTAISVLSTDLYLPSLPHLPELLGSTPQTVQLTMTLNLATFAVAQLAHGPLADWLGRRRLLVLGMAGFAFASLGCAFSARIGDLLVGRVAQAVFSSVPSVVVMLLIVELYGRERSVRMLSLHGMAVAMVPLVGPIVGGYVFVHAGWRSNFVLLAVAAAAVLLLVLRFVPEPPAIERRSVHLSRVFADYLTVMTMPAGLRYLLPLSLIFGALFAFITASPFILIDRLGIPTERYGYHYSIFIAVLMCGYLMANCLARKIAAECLFRAGVALATVGGTALLAAMALSPVTVVAILAPVSPFGIGLALAMTTGPMLLLGLLGPQLRGAGSSLLGALELACASLATLSVSMFHDGSALPMAWTMAAMTGGAALIFAALGMLQRPTEQPGLG